MAGTHFSLDQLRTTYRVAEPDAALRVRQSDATQVTTAERGFGGRVVTFFKPDAQGNRAIGESLLRGLQEAYGPDAGATAFQLVRGGVRAGDDVAIDASKPITARQAREIEDLARALSTEQRRNLGAASALSLAPDAPGFAQLAADAGVDAEALGDDRKELYQRLLQQRVLEAGRFGDPDAPPLGHNQLRDLAASTLRRVAALGDDGVAAAQARLAEQQDAGASLLRELGRPGSDGARLAHGLLRFELAAMASAKDLAQGGTDIQALAQSRAIALDRALADLSPRQARAIYEQAMAANGPGRAMLFGAAVQGCANALHGDTNRAIAGMQLAHSAATVLAALGQRGGVEGAETAVEAVLVAAQSPGDRLAQPGDRDPVRLTKDEVLAAGIKDRRTANAALGKAGTTLDRLARALHKETTRVAQETTSANLRAVRELVLDDTRMGALLDRHLPGHAELSSRARLEIRALVMDQVKRDMRAELLQGGEVRPLVAEGVKGAVERAVAGNAAAIRRVMERPASEDGLAHELLGGRLAGTMHRVTNIAQRRLEARLLASSGDGASLDQQETRRIAAELAALPNRELLGHLRDILSVEMVELRLALQSEPHNLSAQAALADLNMFEGLVHEEIASRVVMAADMTPPQPGETPISGRQAATLADIEKRAQRRDLARQNTVYLEGNLAAPRTEAPGAISAAQRTGLPVADLDKALREADLTVNLPANLFKPGGPFIGADGRAKPEEMRLKNIFERPPELKGPFYIERRVAFEHLEMPTLRTMDADGIKPADHPISAGLNVGRNVGGAAPGYGACLIVLKDEVKQARATFTAQDSFNTFTARATPETVAAFAAEIEDRIDECSPALLDKASWKQLKRDLPVIKERLAEAGRRGERLGLGEAKSLSSFISKDLLNNLACNNKETRNLLFNIGARQLGDPVESPSHVASFQRIEDILGNIADSTAEPVLTGLATTAADPLRVNTVPKGYIEAQVFGGIDLLRDVKEIRIAPEKFDEGARQALIRLGQDYNIPVTFLDPIELSATVQVDRTVKADISAVIPGEAVPQMVTSMDGFRASGRLERVLDVYRPHEQDFDPGAVNGRMHVARTLIYADVMANVIRSKGGVVNSDVLFTAVGLHDAGRQGDGPDRWEAASAAAAKQHYADLGMNMPEAFREHVGACIDGTANPGLVTVEAMILKSADSLDSMRTVGRDGYDPNQLWFMGRDARLGEGRYLPADAALRDGLLDEVAKFITMTEPKVPSREEYLRVKDEVAARTAELADTRAGLTPAAERRSIQAMEAELEGLRNSLEVLGDQVEAETQAFYASRDSLEILDSAVATLRDNAGEFPLMNKYYRPDGTAPS